MMFSRQSGRSIYENDSLGCHDIIIVKRRPLFAIRSLDKRSEAVTEVASQKRLLQPRRPL